MLNSLPSTFLRPTARITILGIVTSAAKSVAAKVAVVPGATFLPETDKATYSFRMNYSMPTEDQIVKGVAALAGVLKDMGL